MRRTFHALGSIVLLHAASLSAAAPAPAPRADTASAVFAGGCFWGVEGVFEHVKGVISATAGYAGGSVSSPSYTLVSTGTTGHAESVRVVYDPTQVSYDELLQVFFTVIHDPTERNRQGPDVGTQYRSMVFYRDSIQRQHAEAYIAELTRRKVFRAPIVTEIVPLSAFYPAEEHHQHFMARHPDYPYIVFNDAPKVKALQQQYPALYREPAGD